MYDCLGQAGETAVVAGLNTRLLSVTAGKQPKSPRRGLLRAAHRSGVVPWQYEPPGLDVLIDGLPMYHVGLVHLTEFPVRDSLLADRTSREPTQELGQGLCALPLAVSAGRGGKARLSE
jgi:hypothetical protein